MHEFADDVSAHDDKQLFAGFSEELELVEQELTEVYGVPARTGETDDEVIPLGGVFKFAVWVVGDLQHFVAA